MLALTMKSANGESAIAAATARKREQSARKVFMQSPSY
jgi:hypothetical protein